MKTMVIHLTDSNFQKEVIESPVPVLVDFWAEWCMPCKMIAPTVKAVAAEYKDTIRVGKLNVEEASSVATRYGIMSIPTLLMFKNGKVMNKMVGAASKSDLEQFINSNL